MSQGQLLPTPPQPQPQPPTYNIPSDMSDASSVSTLTYDTSMFHLPVGGLVRSTSGKERNMIGHHASSNGYGMGLRANASAKINAIVHRSPSRGGMNSTYHQEQQQQQRIHNHQDVAMMDENNRVVSASSISSSPTNSQGSSGISYDSSSYSGEGNGTNGVVGMNAINTGRRVKGTVARSFLRTASEKMMRLKSVNEGTTDHAEISESAVFV